MHATWSGREDIAVFVDFHAVGKSQLLILDPGCSVIKNSAIGDRAIRLNIECHPNRLGEIGVGNVEGFLIRRKGDAVGSGHFFRKKRELTVGRYAVDAAEIEFASWIFPVLFKTVGGSVK